MATLPTNFKDDILDTSVNTRRRYRVYENTDGTIELEDVTEYSQVGDEFGAGRINATNTEVNKKFDKNMIVRDLNTINAITKEGYVPDALALKEVNDSLVADIYVGEDGKLHKVQGGADSVLPFSSSKYFRTTEFLASSSVKEYEIGFRPKFLMFIVSGGSCSYDEVINKQFYNGGYGNAVSLGTWVGSNSFNITEITDTGFKAQVYSGYNNKPMTVFAAG